MSSSRIRQHLRPRERARHLRNVVLPPRRRFQLFGVGHGKTGTHSLEAVFAANYRTDHEPEVARFLALLTGLYEGRCTRDEVRRYLRFKDRRLRLEVDAAGLNGVVIDDLVELFPSARFALTIRDPWSWLDSHFNHVLGRTPSAEWLRWWALRMGGFEYAAGDEVLKEHGLHPLAGYLSHWRHHNEQVLTTVPADRLVVVRTDKLGDETAALAALVGVDPSTLRPDRSHAFPARAKLGVLAQLDEAYLNGMIAEHCGPLVERYFPELASARL